MNVNVADTNGFLAKQMFVPVLILNVGRFIGTEKEKKMKNRPIGLKYIKHKENPTSFKKGFIPWNKNQHPIYMQGENHPMWKKGKPKCLHCGDQLNRYLSKICWKCYVKKNPHKGKVNSEETRKKISKALTGKPQPWQREKNHYNWKGGISTLERNREYFRTQYRNWRKAVFEKNDYTCQNCKERGKVLNADHIKPWILFPELRYEINNGRTLCTDCHILIGWRGHKIQKNKMGAIYA